MIVKQDLSLSFTIMLMICLCPCLIKDDEKGQHDGCNQDNGVIGLPLLLP